MTVPEPTPVEAEGSRTLREAVDRLNSNIERLAGTTAMSRRQLRVNRIISACLAALLFIVVVAGTTVLWQIHQTVVHNATNATVQCENTNDSRKANLTLWLFLLNQPPDHQRTPEEEKQIREIRVWVGKLFAARDCDHLGTHVELPPPPDFGNKG